MIHDVSHATNAPARTIAPDDQRNVDLLKQKQPAARGDSVELSEAARQHADDTPVREGLVSSVREQIASGSYLTDEKLSTALDALLREALG